MVLCLMESWKLGALGADDPELGDSGAIALALRCAKQDHSGPAHPRTPWRILGFPHCCLRPS